MQKISNKQSLTLSICHTADRAATEMNEVPFIGKPVLTENIGTSAKRRFDSAMSRHEVRADQRDVPWSPLSVFFLEPTYATFRIENTLFSSEERMRRG